MPQALKLLCLTQVGRIPCAYHQFRGRGDIWSQPSTICYTVVLSWLSETETRIRYKQLSSMHDSMTAKLWLTYNYNYKGHLYKGQLVKISTFTKQFIRDASLEASSPNFTVSLIKDIACIYKSVAEWGQGGGAKKSENFADIYICT